MAAVTIVFWTPLHTLVFGPAQGLVNIVVSGNIEAHQSVLSFTDVEAPITYLPFDEGREVKTGVVLARVDDRLYRQQVQMDLAALEVAHEQVAYEYIASRLPSIAPELARGRTVVAHLGNGASLCALQGGRSVDSTMGFSALEGLVMGTRPGNLDPGVVLYLLQEQGLDAGQISHLLYHDCGLKGLSGLSGDMRELLASDTPAARLALAVFAHRVAQSVAAMAASMGGLDGLVFTAGIGEHAPGARAAIVQRLGLFGARLDAVANAGSTGVLDIAAPDSHIALRVVPTDEELMIAQHTLKLLRA
ncbi:acetate/propionate family kinase [Metallibacterium sp.]